MNCFLCHEWSSTKGNHAGMIHLCEIIKKNDSNHVRVFVVSKDKLPLWCDFFGKIIHIRNNRHKLMYLWLAIKFIFILSPKSRLYLMEYYHTAVGQDIVARIVRFFRRDIRILGMAHLVPSALDAMFTHKQILQWSGWVDQIMTLGTSLTQYFISHGISNNRVSTLFHYVDSEYYNKNISQIQLQKDNFTVIFMGAMERNLGMLYNVVRQTPNICYNLCLGRSNQKDKFVKLNNARVFGYVSEDELREIMNQSMVSINIMNDTIGSNVITTSLAMGLAMVVSDVGSIRDYCCEQNTIFCTEEDDFVKAIQYLHDNIECCNQMRIESVKLSKQLSAKLFYENIQSC